MKGNIKKLVKDNKVTVLCSVITIIAITISITYPIAFYLAMDSFNKKVAGINERQVIFNKLNDLDQTIRQDYLGEIDENELQKSLCLGYVNGLQDSYSFYMSDEIYKMYQSMESGKAFNIGVTTIRNGNGQTEVIDVLDSSPAKKAGVLKGDIILGINSHKCELMRDEEVLIRLTATKGSNVDLQILRNRSDTDTDNLNLTVSAENPGTNNNIVYSKLGDQIGYINIFDFDNLSPKKFQESLDTFKIDGIVNYIIDLRNNLSGNIKYAAQILDYILPSGELISSVKKDGTKELLYSSSGSMISGQFVVLVNNSTSCAGEIFATCMMEYNAAKIIGENTAGRTTYNKVFPLSDGSAILIPIANYATFNDKIITGTGLVPNKTVNMDTKARALLNRRSLAIEDDAQIQESIKELIGEPANQEAPPEGSNNQEAPPQEQTEELNDNQEAPPQG